MNKLEKWILETDSDFDKDSTDGDASDGSFVSMKSQQTSTKNESDTSKLLSAILKNQTISKLPSNEPMMFSGENITEYSTFTLSFERLIEEHCSSDKDRFYYLLRYTSGDANQLVASCQNADAVVAFKDAKQLLKDRYGNESGSII